MCTIAFRQVQFPLKYPQNLFAARERPSGQSRVLPGRHAHLDCLDRVLGVAKDLAAHMAAVRVAPFRLILAA